MKRIFLSLTMVLLTVGAVFAQNRTNAQSLLSKLDKSNADIQDEKKAARAATWSSRGDLLFDLATANTGVIYEGMSEKEAILLIGNPTSNEIPIVEIGGVDYKKYTYPSLEVYFTMDGTTAFWNETNTLLPNALDQAADAYAKAAELDAKTTKKMSDNIKRIINQYKIEGQNLYNFGDYAGASELFAKAGKLGSSTLVNEQEPEILYFAGVAAAQADEYAKSNEYLSEALKQGYEAEGMVNYYMAYNYNRQNNPAQAEASLLQGVEKYPSNQDLLNSLISHYISSNDDPNKVIPYIKKAQENDPENAILFIAEGVAYEGMKEYDKAENAYKQALQKQPNFFDPLYNLGLMFNIRGEDNLDELRSIDYTNQQAYSAKEDEAIANFTKAIDYFEQAHKVNPNDRNTIQLLKNLFFRLRDEGPEMMAGYEKYKALDEQ